MTELEILMQSAGVEHVVKNHGAWLGLQQALTRSPSGLGLSILTHSESVPPRYTERRTVPGFFDVAPIRWTGPDEYEVTDEWEAEDRVDSAGVLARLVSRGKDGIEIRLTQTWPFIERRVDTEGGR